MFLIWVGFVIGTDGKRQLWGDITTNVIGQQEEDRQGFPFFSRETTVSFPSVSPTWIRNLCSFLNFLFFFFFLFWFWNSKETNTARPHDYTYFIRGIVHVNHLDPEDCPPELNIIEGGIYENNATVQIVSKPGCGIDSTILFYGDKYSRN